MTRLTSLQERALCHTLNEGDASDYFFYDYGGGPCGWRTFRSLQRRGLVEFVEHDLRPEGGSIWRLSRAGQRVALDLWRAGKGIPTGRASA